MQLGKYFRSSLWGYNDSGIPQYTTIFYAQFTSLGEASVQLFRVVLVGQPSKMKRSTVEGWIPLGPLFDVTTINRCAFQMSLVTTRQNYNVQLAYAIRPRMLQLLRLLSDFGYEICNAPLSPSASVKSASQGCRQSS